MEIMIIIGLFTLQSDFAFGLQVYNTNSIFLYMKKTSLLQNCALILDVLISLMVDINDIDRKY